MASVIVKEGPRQQFIAVVCFCVLSVLRLFIVLVVVGVPSLALKQKVKAILYFLSLVGSCVLSPPEKKKRFAPPVPAHVISRDNNVLNSYKLTR